MSLPKSTSTRLRNALLVFIAILYTARIPLAFRLNINWDEFRFLSLVYDYAEGRLSTALQSSHVHLFQWLVGLGATEVDQVVAARLSYLALVLLSTICLYKIASRFLSVTASLFVVLCYLAYSNLIQHGASFRTDGLAGFLILVCLFFLVGRVHTVSRLAIAAVGLAGAFLVTVKTVLWLPTLLFLVWAGDPRNQQQQLSRLGRLAIFVLVAMVAVSLGSFMHRQSLPSVALGQVMQNAQAAGVKVFTAGLFPQGHYLLLTIVENIYIWICVLAGAVVICRRYQQKILAAEELWSLLSLAIPVVSVLVYRNSFPYFYVFVIPPLLLLVGFTWDHVAEIRRGVTGAHVLLPVLLVAVAASGIVHVVRNVKDGTRTQRLVLEVVHDLFPEPVPYIDRSSMVSSFPKVGFFMSSWGLETYWRRDVPIFEPLLRSEAPVLMVQNSPVLELGDRIQEFEQSPPFALMPGDRQVLTENFVALWGPVYVAGKHFRLAQDEERRVEFLIQGRYRLDATLPIIFDGRQVVPGQLVDVEVGTYSLMNERAEQTIRLTIEMARVDRLPPAPSEPIFTGF